MIMKNKMKKVVGIVISTAMIFSLFLGVSQGVRAEEYQDPTEFAGALGVGNATHMDSETKKICNVYLNDEGFFQSENNGVPARGPAKIMVNQAYKTRMDYIVSYNGGVYDPGPYAYYYFTLDKPAKVTIYGKCSTASNSYLSVEKMDKIDETFRPSTDPLGRVQSEDAVKSISTYLSEGQYLVCLGWGQGRPQEAGKEYSYVKVDADYSVNQEADDEWNETFPNEWINKAVDGILVDKRLCTPYSIGKKMNGVTNVGSCNYFTGYYSFAITEKTQLHFAGLSNIARAYVYPKDGGQPTADNCITALDNAMILEPGDYILETIAESEGAYSFNTDTSAVPVTAGVDTVEGLGDNWSVSGDTVTINNLKVNAKDYAEFCIWSGDKDNAGYGKGTAKLVIKGNCFIKTLVIDCPVEVSCEQGAKLVVEELKINTADGANGKLTYVGKTTYNATTKTFIGATTSDTPTPDTPTPGITPTTKPTPAPVVKPAKAKIASAKNNKKKTITVKITKTENAKSYKVQYATDKKFKKVKTKISNSLSVVLKGLKKKKTYYIRVCGVNGKVVGDWSSVKKVKVKK